MARRAATLTELTRPVRRGPVGPGGRAMAAARLRGTLLLPSSLALLHFLPWRTRSRARGAALELSDHPVRSEEQLMRAASAR